METSNSASRSPNAIARTRRALGRKRGEGRARETFPLAPRRPRALRTGRERRARVAKKVISVHTRIKNLTNENCFLSARITDPENSPYTCPHRQTVRRKNEIRGKKCIIPEAQSIPLWLGPIETTFAPLRRVAPANDDDVVASRNSSLSRVETTDTRGERRDLVSAIPRSSPVPPSRGGHGGFDASPVEGEPREGWKPRRRRRLELGEVDGRHR